MAYAKLALAGVLCWGLLVVLASGDGWRFAIKMATGLILSLVAFAATLVAIGWLFVTALKDLGY